MRTYYSGRDAVVTSELFVRRVTSAKSYAIRDLRNVSIVRDQGGLRSRPVIAGAAGAVGLTGAAIALAASKPDALMVVLVATALTVAGIVGGPRRPAIFELRADYRGRVISLYSSRDETMFYQVTRALRRAVEAANRWERFEVDDAA